MLLHAHDLQAASIAGSKTSCGPGTDAMLVDVQFLSPQSPDMWREVMPEHSIWRHVQAREERASCLMRNGQVPKERAESRTDEGVEGALCVRWRHDTPQTRALALAM